MLKQRLITALLLVPFILGGIWFLPTQWLSGIVALVMVLAAWEWLGIVGFHSDRKKVLGLVVITAVTGLISLFPERVFFLLILGIWSAILLIVIRYAHRPLAPFIHVLISKPLSALVQASLVLALFFHATLWLHALTAQLLLHVVVLVWLADTGGYFAGKRWGRHALATMISPNKTWEGILGALVLCLAWSGVTYMLFFQGVFPFETWMMLALVTTLISVVGDLFESLFKRCHGVKDSGNLLPGHGGILDRIDSLIAAIPVFAASLYFLEYSV